jgi:hypothetical protein
MRAPDVGRGLVAARRQPVATHALVGAVPTSLFLCSESDGSSAAEVMDLSEIGMATGTRSPIPRGEFLY